MKKKFFQVLLVMIMVVSLSACGTKKKDAKKEKSAEDLVAQMLEAYKEGSADKFNDVLPDFMEIKTTNEEFKSQVQALYGEIKEVSYNITNKKKEDDTWLSENNKIIKEMYKTDKEMTECYLLEGTITIKGTKNEKTDNLEEVWYCKIENKWYLMFG